MEKWTVADIPSQAGKLAKRVLESKNIRALVHR